MELDFEAAKLAQPNFKIFYDTFKDHPSLGPAPVEDSAVLVSETSVIDSDDAQLQYSPPPSDDTSFISMTQSDSEVGEDSDKENEPQPNKTKKDDLRSRVKKRERLL